MNPCLISLLNRADCQGTNLNHCNVAEMVGAKDRQHAIIFRVKWETRTESIRATCMVLSLNRPWLSREARSTMTMIAILPGSVRPHGLPTIHETSEKRRLVGPVPPQGGSALLPVVPPHRTGHWRASSRARRSLTIRFALITRNPSILESPPASASDAVPCPVGDDASPNFRSPFFRSPIACCRTWGGIARRDHLTILNELCYLLYVSLSISKHPSPLVTPNKTTRRC